MLEKLTKLLLVCYLFLSDYRILNIPIPLIVLLFSISSVFLFRKKWSISPIFNKDRLKEGLALILFFTVVTYLIKSVNNEQIVNTYYHITGQRPPALYLKMIMNGIFMLMTAMLALSIGLAYRGNEEGIRRIIRFMVNLISIYALINIIAWAGQTRGVVGRYNFVPGIGLSPGIAIQWCILGFILQLSIINGYRRIGLQILKLIILFISILIIVSRRNQIMFLIVLFLYLLLSYRGITRLKILAFSIILLASFWYLTQPLLDVTFFDTYQKLSENQSDDLLIRRDIIGSALDIFSNNILFGVGYGMFAGYNTVTVFNAGAKLYLASPHNGFVSILAEMGLVGFIVNILIIKQIINRLHRSRILISAIDIEDYKVITAIFVFLTTNIILVFISNYLLLPPPSEYSYYGIAFVCWLLIGIVLSWQNNLTLQTISE